MNYVKTVFLLVLLTVLLMWIGGLIGGQQGAMVAFVISLLINGVSYWFSDKIVLAMYRAKELSMETYPQIHRIIEDLCAKAEIPKPRVFMADMDVPNAFATGRDPKHAVVCLTTGIMNALDERELKGVIAHELAHIKNRDTLIMTITAALASSIMMLASMARWAAIAGGFSRDREESGNNVISLIAISIIAPLAAMMVQLAISRSREYIADAAGAGFSKDPEGLANALLDLSQFSKRAPMDVNPQTAHMFIVSPFGKLSMIANLFSTHPPIEERVKRLKGMA